MKTLIIVWLPCALSTLALFGNEPISFRNQVAPILVENCTSCHGPKKAEGGYRLDTFAQLQKAGDSGVMPLIVVEGQHAELTRRLVTPTIAERMPAEREPLAQTEIDVIAQWQAEGSKFDGDDPQMQLYELVPARNYPAPPVAYRAPLPITAVAFSPDGSQVIASGYHELTVWDAVTSKLVRRIGNLPERVHSLDWSGDQKLLAVAGGMPGHVGEVRLVDWEAGQVTESFGRATDVVQVVRFQPAGTLIATGNTDGTLRWYDKNQLQLVRTVASHADIVNDIAWSVDGKRLGSASRDKTAKVFVVENAELIATYSGHGDSVTGICFNQGDKEVTTIGADKKLHRWQIEDAKNLAKVDLAGTPTRLHRQADTVWVSLSTKSIQQLELAASKHIRKQDGHSHWVTAVASHVATGRLASATLDGEVRVWKIEDGSLLNHWLAKP